MRFWKIVGPPYPKNPLAMKCNQHPQLRQTQKVHLTSLQLHRPATYVETRGYSREEAPSESRALDVFF